MEVQKKIVSFLKRHDAIVYSFFINAIVMVMFLFMFYSKYQNQSDIIMQSVLYGVSETGIASAHILFSQYLLGSILKVLFDCIPSIAWYTIMHLVASFSALVVIGCVTLSRNRTKFGKIITCITLCFLGYECYVLLGYMKSAAILGTAFIYLWTYVIEKELFSKRYIIVCGLLAVWSSLLSIKVFAVIVVIGIVLLVIYCVNRGLLKKHWKRNIIFFVTVIIVCLGIYGIDYISYYNQDGYELELEYRDEFEKVLSFGAPDYDEDVAQTLNIDSSNTYNYLKNNLFINGNESVYETIEEMATMKKDISLKSINTFFKSVPISLLSVEMFYCWLILSVLILITADRESKKIVLYSFIVLVVVFFLFYLLNALEKVWVSNILLIPLVVHLLMAFHNIESKMNNSIIIYIFVMFFVLYSNFSKDITTSIRNDDISLAFQNLDENEKYYIDLNNYFQQFSVYKVYPRAVCVNKNICTINGIYSFIYGFESSNCVDELDETANSKWLYNSDNKDIFSIPIY